ncbi:MAG: PTS mannose transporter subunit IIA [Aerococcus sp.]|nr:PTS mannose transporter subunit IIA [Aerococcus sp.]
MTTKYLIASHGRLAEGLQSSVDILAGMAERIQVINAYVDDRDYVPEITAFLTELAPEDQAVIFTDMLGGSVNQKVFQEIIQQDKQQQAFIVTNANLPVVMGVLLSDQVWDGEALNAVIAESAIKLIDLTQM